MTQRAGVVTLRTVLSLLGVAALAYAGSIALQLVSVVRPAAEDLRGRTRDLLRDHAMMEEARREAVAALDDVEQVASLASLVNTAWEHRFGLVGIG